jgi:hypothetical protein
MSVMTQERTGGRSVDLVVLVLLATDDGVIPLADGTERPRELEGRHVSHLARGCDSWWAIADHHTIVQRGADGIWRDVATSDASLTCLLPRPHGAICGTADGRLLSLLEDRWRPIETFDAVAGRDTWHAVGSSEPYVRSVTVTADDRALLANVHVGGIPRSGNGGASWKPTIDPDADVHEVRAHPTDPRLVLAPAAVGLGVSRDAGKTWEVETGGLHATYSRAVAFTVGSALVSVSDGPFTSQSALYRWDALDGGALERVEGLPEWLAGNVDTGHLATHDAACAFADKDAVYTSDDAGRSWTRATTDGKVRGVSVSTT